MSGAVCPGSFDPVTSGHLYVFERAAARFDELVILVTVNPKKHGFFGIDERLELIRETTAHLPNVRVDSWQGLLVDYVRQQGLDTIVKGLRGAVDFEYEMPMAQMNRDLTGVETVFLLTDPRLAHVSSSLVKEVARLGGAVGDFLPPLVHEQLLAKLSDERQV
ncbi:MAG: pantetheine-phosphate adenylyltransferase [Gordonia sp.]|uniref:pantetheine-phosphate adenylyltransferase n=1 Tax=Williamsia sp. 1138 TaxID=1903117 RepID=UPI000A10932D|nr:pantetheine-phosphate adenylyltransferase [Williamsia sp. 1138]MBA4024762.1 pantetheine-phosphate adenylyltransferase [Gordonia sp. (in: high G+C Gram-positive bacteria)]OZG26801.1 pantetheine-phosphate adenylyltransferase [Williamsia sp. 1138]